MHCYETKSQDVEKVFRQLMIEGWFMEQLQPCGNQVYFASICRDSVWFRLETPYWYKKQTLGMISPFVKVSHEPTYRIAVLDLRGTHKRLYTQTCLTSARPMFHEVAALMRRLPELSSSYANRCACCWKKTRVMSVCQRCKCSLYCSTICQQHHFGVHNDMCEAIGSLTEIEQN